MTDALQEDVAWMTEVGRRRTVTGGHPASDGADEVLVVLSGALARGRAIAVRPGDLAGGAPLLRASPAADGLRALGDTVLLALPRAEVMARARAVARFGGRLRAAARHLAHLEGASDGRVPSAGAGEDAAADSPRMAELILRLLDGKFPPV